jgi:hypothetical protein
LNKILDSFIFSEVKKTGQPEGCGNIHCKSAGNATFSLPFTGTNLVEAKAIEDEK